MPIFTGAFPMAEWFPWCSQTRYSSSTCEQNCTGRCVARVHEIRDTWYVIRETLHGIILRTLHAKIKNIRKSSPKHDSRIEALGPNLGLATRVKIVSSISGGDSLHVMDTITLNSVSIEGPPLHVTLKLWYSYQPSSDCVGINEDNALPVLDYICQGILTKSWMTHTPYCQPHQGHYNLWSNFSLHDKLELSIHFLEERCSQCQHHHIKSCPAAYLVAEDELALVWWNLYHSSVVQHIPQNQQSSFFNQKSRK